MAKRRKTHKPPKTHPRITGIYSGVVDGELVTTTLVTLQVTPQQIKPDLRLTPKPRVTFTPLGRTLAREALSRMERFYAPGSEPLAAPESRDDYKQRIARAHSAAECSECGRTNGRHARCCSKS